MISMVFKEEEPQMNSEQRINREYLEAMQKADYKIQFKVFCFTKLYDNLELFEEMKISGLE